ncbi:sugar phosphate isomerase/epimerase [Halobacteroides halobius DSM 5150]|uniref:Sugar phosphate isomerase/epimerase n=1 Tax=Halobacteroides halobius (strain ATCC 35273 / DSM 5150 / MD-1) TaxID=748449 RepID=L0K8E5_HALHC|nr:sugar phosphate isomerase/epimerase [Halobacteroides halobius]AGB40795.1 sugar phosphate isomerase/epimerase [Halobacteroides halobius DSM 5150]
MKLPVAVQLYTLRDETEKDFIGVLEEIAQMGYQGVEFAGYGGLTAEELKLHLDRLGLKSVGSHVGIEELTNNLEEVITFNQKLGTDYLVCPWAEYEERTDYINMAQQLTEIGKKCRAEGLQLCYHNHDHEFEEFNGEYGLDLIYEETNSRLVQAELDTFWIKYAGLDVVSYIKKYSNRCPLIHLKDMEAESKDYLEIGNGIMKIDQIILTAKEAGAKWLIVEQDECKGSAIESVKTSFENLKRLDLA